MLLYKYFRPYQTQGSNHIIAENLFTQLLIRFTQPSDFDDPFDCLPQVDMENKEYFRRLFKQSATQFKKVRHFDELPLEERIFQDGRLSELEERKIEQDIFLLKTKTGVTK